MSPSRGSMKAFLRGALRSEHRQFPRWKFAASQNGLLKPSRLESREPPPQQTTLGCEMPDCEGYSDQVGEVLCHFLLFEY